MTRLKYTAWEWTRAYLALILQLPFWIVFGGYALAVGRLPDWLTKALLKHHRRYTGSHDMDFRIPPDPKTGIYMARWWRVPRNWAFNIYFHIVHRSDDDRALHDHPWMSLSIVLDGGYYEHEILAGGIHRRTWFGPGSMRFRWAGKMAHRLELETLTPERDGVSYRELAATTVFITGPVLRRWGFHHETGWVDAYDWDRFCEANGINAMRMDGGSDAAVSPRNRLS